MVEDEIVAALEALETDGSFTAELAVPASALRLALRNAGYSDPLLAHHQKASNIARIRRGIYRLVHFLPGDGA